MLEAGNTPEMVILPGGMPGAATLDASPVVDVFLRAAESADAYIAAICAAPMILGKRGLLKGKNATCFPGCESQMGKANMVNAAAVTDGKLITGTSAGCAVPFGLKLVEVLKGSQEAQRIAKQIVIR